MPWKDGATFAAAHNKKLTGKAADKAAEMANAMLKEGIDEGTAIATANKHGNKLMRRSALYDHPRSKGFAEGGEVKEKDVDDMVEAERKARGDWSKDHPRFKGTDVKTDPGMGVDPSPATRDKNEIRTLPTKRDKETDGPDDYPDEVELAKGGKVTEVTGKPVGKDDGQISVQVGEYVVRKSAVKKLGTKTLDEINKGRIPAMYDHPRSRKHG